MPSYDRLTNEWLSTLLTNLGDTNHAVASRLRDALITGRPRSASDCPIARYVVSRIREHVAPGDEVMVAVSSYVRATIRFADGSNRELDVVTPEAVSEFISTFDTYGPLVEKTAA